MVQFSEIVNRPGDLDLGQWVQLYAFCLEFSPDLIVELGRGYGNSTCVFTEAANRLSTARVVSIGYDAEQTWSTYTAPRLVSVVTAQWFEPLRVLHQDILETNFSSIFATGKRIFLFWDAHGHRLAQHLLAEVLPLLQAKEHIVVVHDIADSRYFDPEPAYAYKNGPPLTWLGHLVGPFEELILLYDFLSRNRIAFDTPNHSLDQQVLHDIEKRAEIQRSWGDDFPSPAPLETGYWIYFDLNHRQRHQEIAFPSSAQLRQQETELREELEVLRGELAAARATLARVEPVLRPLRWLRGMVRGSTDRCM